MAANPKEPWPLARRPIMLTVLGTPWLGHGRMSEALVATVCLLYGMALAFAPESSFSAPRATWLLAYLGWVRLFALPVLLTAVLAGGGLVLNIAGDSRSRHVRFAGAFCGNALWVFLAYNLAATGDYVSVGFWSCVAFAGLSIRIMALALAGLPTPGSPGVQG